MNTVTSIAISLASIFSFFTAEFSSPASSPEKTAIESNVLASPPERVKVNSCGASVPTGVQGIYTKIANSGNSSCGCWDGPNGGSLGKNGNDWMIFPQPGCLGSASIKLGTTTSCDPKSLSCIAEPKIIISKCGPSTGTADGTYEKSSTNNASTCGCWNRTSGGQPQSFGQIGGMWVVFFAKDCPAITGSGAGQYVPLKTDSSCDPLVVGCVKLD